MKGKQVMNFNLKVPTYRLPFSNKKMKVARKSIQKGKLIPYLVTVLKCIKINYTGLDRGGDTKSTDTKYN